MIHLLPSLYLYSVFIHRVHIFRQHVVLYLKGIVILGLISTYWQLFCIHCTLSSLLFLPFVVFIELSIRLHSPFSKLILIFSTCSGCLFFHISCSSCKITLYFFMGRLIALKYKKNTGFYLLYSSTLFSVEMIFTCTHIFLWRISFNISCKYGLLAKKFPQFLLSEKGLFLHFLVPWDTRF